jgi:hypothetical protein
MRIIGAAIGRHLRFEEHTIEEAREQLSRFASPTMVEAMIGYYGSAAASGGAAPTSPIVEQVVGRPAQTFAQWAHDHAEAFK